MTKLRSLAGKAAVVTGASSGIGCLLAERLVRHGLPRVALVARRQHELETLATTLRELGADALTLPCDVSDARAVEQAAAAVAARFGTVDLLVNNAGYGRHRRFLDQDLADIERMLDVNFLGSARWTRALLPAMVERGQGWIVFMASVAGKLGVPGESAYVASKFAMVGFAEALSMEVEDAGVHVLTVCPGAVRTDFFDPRSYGRMPAIARRSMIEPAQVVDSIMKALARGKREVTIPRAIAAAYLVRAIAPSLVRRGTRRATRDGLDAGPSCGTEK